MDKRQLPKRARDNRANQLNPIHPEYHRSRGRTADEAVAGAERAKLARDPDELVTNNDERSDKQTK